MSSRGEVIETTTGNIPAERVIERPDPAPDAELRYCPDNKFMVKVCPFEQTGFGSFGIAYIG
jgi:hypothetical protein